MENSSQKFATKNPIYYIGLILIAIAVIVALAVPFIGLFIGFFVFAVGIALMITGTPTQARKISTWLIFVIAFLVVGVIGYALYFSPAARILKSPTAQPAPAASAPIPATQQDAGWKTYTDTQHRFSFQYPQNIAFVPIHTSYVSFADGVQADIPSSYGLPNDFQHAQTIYVGTVSANSSADCLPASSHGDVNIYPATPMTFNGISFNKYVIGEDCAMDGCSTGNTYKTWQNNTCYALSWFAIQASPTKFYDTETGPDITAALAAADQTSKNITNLAEKILATFALTTR